MFKQRLLTALVLIPIVWLAIYYAQGPGLLGVIGVLVAAMTWEWTALIPLSSRIEKTLFFVGLILSIVVLQLLFLYGLIVGFILWLGVLLIIMTYPETALIWARFSLLIPLAWMFLGLFALSLWYLLDLNHGKALLVYLLGLVWATDTGAYIFGKLWGKHRLIPLVSPGKTWEGTMGGLLLGSAVAGIGVFYFHPRLEWYWFIQAWIIILVSMLGDLWISVLKRRVQIKDTGHLLPGHGGILDRLDSLLACLPFFYYFSLNY